MRQRTARLSWHALSYLAAPRYRDRSELQEIPNYAGLDEVQALCGSHRVRRAVLPASGRRECGRWSTVPEVPRAQLLPGVVACVPCLEVLHEKDTWTEAEDGRADECTWCAGTMSPADGTRFHRIKFFCHGVSNGRRCPEHFCHRCIQVNLGQPVLDAMISAMISAPRNPWVRAVVASRLVCVIFPSDLFSRRCMWLWCRSPRAATLDGISGI